MRLIAEQLLAQALARLEADTAPPLTQQHELIREPTEYAEFFRQRSDALNPLIPTKKVTYADVDP